MGKEREFAMGEGTARRKGGRRSYLKRFSSTIIGGTSNIDKHYFRETAQRAHALSHRDIAFMKLFGLHDPTTANRQARMARGEREPFLVETPRDRVLKELSDALQQVNPLHNVCMIPKTLFMFWDDHGFYFLVKVNHSNMSYRRSMKYSSREALMFAFQNNCIKWK
jgi:hypothetical protein